MSKTLDDFAKEFDRCFLCGVRGINTWPPRLENHHIARGCNRRKARDERCAIIRTCQGCHQSRLDGMEPVTQYALKLMNDPAGYDRTRLNELRGRQPSAITTDEVELEMLRLTALSVSTGFPFSIIRP